MTTQYAFYFDSAFCSGCKACQAACKDKNDLPPGVLWRRVYEVSGGGWEQSGQAWTNTVFAYHFSAACNHCLYPKCAGVCPVDAYTVRPDGIVLLDSSKCIGCGYCAWACPYGAPQYDRSAGYMSKCNFCFDNIDEGLPPACIAACPMRVLDYEDAGGGRATPAGYSALWETPAGGHPFPLPSYSRTEPHLAVKPHAAMSLPLEKHVANREEIAPQPRTGWEEAPLVVFTLLAQMAAGGFWTLLWMFTPFWNLVEYNAAALRRLPLLMIGLSLGLGMAASFAHLGTKRNAWRAFMHVRKSWLSREILFALLFGAGWLLSTLAAIIRQGIPAGLFWLTALLGFGLVYSMGQVYRLRAVAAWNSWRTNAGFFLSALLLGTLLMTCALAYESHLTGIQPSAVQWRMIGFSVLALLALRGWVTRPPEGHHFAERLWRVLLLAGILAACLLFLISGLDPFRVSLVIFLIVLSEEAAARWSFYASRP